MRNLALLVAVVSCCSALAPAQQDFPFSKYPVTSTYHGAPAPPRLSTPDERRFRTLITEGAKKGPNFAGHYTVVTWGCGAACASFAIVDAITGGVFTPPFGVSFESADGQFYKESGLYYQLDSSLFVIQGAPGEKAYAQYLYRWTGNNLEEIQSTALQPLPRTPMK
jgi:hypothetical protein